MRTFRWLVSVALVGLAVGLISWKLESRDTAQRDAAANREAEQLRAEVAALQGKVQRISERRDARALVSLAPEKPKSPSAAALPDEGPVSHAGLTLQDVLADVPPEQEENFMRELERKESRARKARTLEQLRSEPRDLAWAREVEDLLSNAAAGLDRKEFPSAKVTSIECGTTLCKIEVDQASADEQARFAGAWRTGLRTYGVRRGGPDDAPGEKLGWTLFVARKGHKMPKVSLEEVLASDT